jgi:hypothetical protein
MKKMIFAIGFAALPLTTYAIGFSSGQNFVASPTRGQLRVSCRTEKPGDPGFASAVCRRITLSPAEFDFFVGPAGTEADRVGLKATYEDGSTSAVKNQRYDGAAGKSKSRFNLWIASLTQSPLLNVGVNAISYVLVKGQKLIDRGEFTVVVEKGAPATCKNIGHFYSDNANDCRNPELLCDRYFSEENYCQ